MARRKKPKTRGKMLLKRELTLQETIDALVLSLLAKSTSCSDRAKAILENNGSYHAEIEFVDSPSSRRMNKPFAIVEVWDTVGDKKCDGCGDCDCGEKE